jgi:hypothetical protein
MQELEVTWSRVASVTWLILWRAFAGGSLFGAFGGLLVHIIDAFILHRPGPNPIAAGAVGWLFGLPWFVVVVRMALKKKYGTFRIALVAQEAKL